MMSSDPNDAPGKWLTDHGVPIAQQRVKGDGGCCYETNRRQWCSRRGTVAVPEIGWSWRVLCTYHARRPS